MQKIMFFLLLVSSLSLSGCSTTQDVTLTKIEYKRQISSVVQVMEPGNSPKMSKVLEDALKREGLVVAPALPAGKRSSSEVDALVSYIDVWQWDLTTYLESITIRLYDSQTGDLLASGTWRESAQHWYRDENIIVGGLVADIFGKLRGATSILKQ
jgi:hypothetical protein